MTVYQECKQLLKQEAEELKLYYPTDKPAIRTGINDCLDYLCKDNQLTERQRDNLSLYACKLHPKN